MSKKHNKRKQSTDIVSLFNEAVRSENISLNKKFKNEVINENDVNLNRDPNDIFNLNNKIKSF